MDETVEEPSFGVVSLRRMRWDRLRRKVVSETFPAKNDYVHSLWAEWEQRIRRTYQSEEVRLQREYEEIEKQPIEGFPADFDCLLENYSQNLLLANSMSAALTVSIWAGVEHSLKWIVKEWYISIDRTRTVLPNVQQYCKDALAGRQPDISLSDCVKAPKNLASGIQYKFPDLKEVIKRETSVVLDDCRGYPIVDAIRILNNAFKHNRGRYVPRDAQRNREDLLADWSIVDKNGEIDFLKLPFEDLVCACNAFFSDLIGKVVSEIEKRISGCG